MHSYNVANLRSGSVIVALKNKEVDCIAHVCNDRKVMGSGVALQIKQQIPYAYDAYMNSYSDLSTVTYSHGVFNMIAQAGYGMGVRHLNYGAYAECCVKVKNMMQLLDLHTIGLPYKIGSDRAGGDWVIVREITDHIFGDALYWYKFG